MPPELSRKFCRVMAILTTISGYQEKIWILRWMKMKLKKPAFKQRVAASRLKKENRYLRSSDYQRLSRGYKARGQGPRHKKNPRPRPRTALPRTDPLEAKDRNARGQGQGHKRKCFQKKNIFKNFFQAFSSKKGLLKFFFRRFTKFQQFKKSAVLELRTGQFSRT